MHRHKHSLGLPHTRERPHWATVVRRGGPHRPPSGPRSHTSQRTWRKGSELVLVDQQREGSPRSCPVISAESLSTVTVELILKIKSLYSVWGSRKGCWDKTTFRKEEPKKGGLTRWRVRHLTRAMRKGRWSKQATTWPLEGVRAFHSPSETHNGQQNFLPTFTQAFSD